MQLETERLILRPVTQEDAEDIYEYSRDPRVGPMAGWKPHESLKETRAVIKAVFEGQPHVFGIQRKAAPGLIGTVGLMPDPRRQNDSVLMLGYALAADCWGQGYMTEAAREVVEYGFALLSLDAVSVCVYPHNARSISVINKLGFVLEGTLRLGERRYDGRVLDLECYIKPRADAV